MKKYCWGILAGVLLFARLGFATEIPTGIVYKPAAAELNSKVKASLMKLFAQENPTLGSLCTNWGDKKRGVIIGKFLGDQVLTGRMENPFATFQRITTKVPLRQDDSLQMISYGIKNTEQLVVFDREFAQAVKLKPDFKVRELTTDELMLIWYFIGWDLDEPLFVVDDGIHKIVFDFTPAGDQLTWVEDIGNMEFTIDMGGGNVVKAIPQVVPQGCRKRVVFMGVGANEHYLID